MNCRLLLFACALFLGLTSCQKELLTETPVQPRDESKELQTLQSRADDLDHEIQLLLNAAANGRSGAAVVVPAGSEDALAAAIAAVPEGGTVILAGGDHTESGMVTVNKTVKIIGQRGARLISATQPIPPGIPIQSALYVADAPGTTITGLEMVPAGEVGGTAVLIFNSPGTRVYRNTISEYQFGVLVEASDDVYLAGNQISISLAWTVGAFGEAHGIVIINGEDAAIFNNDIQHAVFGIWACDKYGTAVGNRMHDNLIGLILCKVPEAALPLPNGTFVGAEFSATGWTVTNNQAKNNFDTGYLVIDGANNNYMGISNTASGNAHYDIELTADTYRFGFLTPAAFENEVFARPNMTVKDCGNDNEVHGGILVDTNLDPCF